MSKKAALLIVTALFLSSAATIYAEQGSGKEGNDKQGKNIEKQERIGGQNEEKDVLKENREAIKEEIRVERDAFKKAQKTMKRDFDGSKSAEMEANKEAFKTKIASLTDQKKKLTAERVDAKLASANEKKSTKMDSALTRLLEILNRLIDKANAAKSAGKDTAAVETAIVNAKAALATAQTAVDAQKAKTYTATVTDEASLGQSFSTTFKQLRTDLDGVHEKVKDAKKAVKSVAIELVKLEAGVSVTPTP